MTKAKNDQCDKEVNPVQFDLKNSLVSDKTGKCT
jgi:hypothetical protein